MSFSPVHFRMTSSFGSRTGTVCSNRPFTAVKSAVVAPMPSASDSRTTSGPALGVQQHPVRVLEVVQHGWLILSASGV